MTRRMKVALIGGALLGLVCVIGAFIRSGFTASWFFVFALWYNRVIIGLVVGAQWSDATFGKVLMRGGIMDVMSSLKAPLERKHPGYRASAVCQNPHSAYVA